MRTSGIDRNQEKCSTEDRVKVLVYGSGGRDHCLADKYGDSQHVDKVYFSPGNPGVLRTPKGREDRKLIELVKLKGFGEVADFCVEQGVDLVDVGSENPLEEGLIDLLNSRGIRTVGPRMEYVKLESDRAFTDDLLRRIGVPKPEYQIFDDPVKAKQYVRNIGYQVVVKANGLAAGKGAIVCEDVADATAAIDRIMTEKVFGKSGNYTTCLRGNMGYPYHGERENRTRRNSVGINQGNIPTASVCG